MGGAASPLLRDLSPETAAVCVTGSTGYIGSWLVRSLLQRGYTVHATARDLGKASQLQESAWRGSGGRLKIFRADMGEEGSYDEAVSGCAGVFHVAAEMNFDVPSGTTDVDGYVQKELLKTTVEGTLNLMKSCQRSGTVKRVVLTSSISTATARKSCGEFKPFVDESSLVDVDSVWQKRPPGWVYILSKVAAEESALRFANENKMEFISVVPTTVTGPFLTPQVPSSIRVLLSPITNDPMLHSILLSVHARLGSISIVHIVDLVNAQIFLMETVAATGRYICSRESFVLHELSQLLMAASTSSPFTGVITQPPSLISTKKLTDLGFKFKHGANEIITETLNACAMVGFFEES